MAFDLTVVSGSITNTSARLRAAWSGYTNYADGNYDSAITYNGSTVASVYNSGLTAYEGTLSGLSPGTTYTCSSYLIRDGGSNSDSVTFTTTGSSVIIPDTPSVNSVSVDANLYGTIYYSTGANTVAVKIAICNSSGTELSSFWAGGSPEHGYFPAYNTTYLVKAYANSSSGNSSAWSGYASVTTGPPPLVMGIPEPYTWNIIEGTKSIKVWYTRGQNNERVEMVLYASNGTTILGYVSNYNPGVENITFDTPSWSTTYGFRLRGYSSGGQMGSLSGINYISVGVQNARPLNWSWAVAKVSGANIATTKISEALYYIYPISNTDWSAFTDKINKFLAYKGLSLGSFTTVYGGTDFTNAILMQAINNINRMLSSDFLQSASVDNAYLYTRMRDKLNSIT